MLSLNEIRSRALSFARDHAEDRSEAREAKIFWYEFFAIFGVSQRRVATFEEAITRPDRSKGFIDLLWKGMLLIEHKSRGKNLDTAYSQAKDYFHGLKDRDLPRYILVCDFARFRLYDLEKEAASKIDAEFTLPELPDNIHHFGFISGYKKRDFGKEDPANIEAAERMGALHDALKADGYTGHALEILLVRLLFCLFAEDTSIFETNLFREYIETRTSEDGSDLGDRLTILFQVLNTLEDKRQKSLDTSLAAFPYVDGKLFEEQLPIPSFNSAMRNALLNACALDWSRISPAIFGSLFQSVMDVWVRRHLGAHYTRETNILKALNPLFLDNLRIELDKLRTSRSTARTKQLKAFLDKLACIRILDPACGCGNFLVIAYRELRLLELKTLQLLYPKKTMQGQLNVTLLSKVDVDQCYGIEIEEFPAQIAQVALWLTDHQMNMELSRAFGEYYVRLPLQKSPTIVHGNALALDWREVVAPQDLHYIVSNPPFVGSKMLSTAQRAEMRQVFSDIHGAKILDYVAAWYLKATEYMTHNTHIQTAFVSTNSITQGEQVSILWGELLKRNIIINFAHRTFQWSSEASRRAAVHCIIIGFSFVQKTPALLYDYASPTAEPQVNSADTITPYLTSGNTVLVTRRSQPLCDVPSIYFGNQPIDGGGFILNETEKNSLLENTPHAQIWIKKYLGAEEFIHGIGRWCLWLKDADPVALRKCPLVLKRINQVKVFRLASARRETRALATTPTLFAFISHPDKSYLLIPGVSSEKRTYIPVDFMEKDTVASNACLIIPDATLYHFGILTSAMHMAWVRAVCGRLESRYRYSNSIVYNNFPWPENPTKAQVTAIEKAAQTVLDARAAFPTATLADLYDPNTMPPALLKAHTRLDKVVDAAYGRTDHKGNEDEKGFATEMERMKLLFAMYRAYCLPINQQAQAP